MMLDGNLEPRDPAHHGESHNMSYVCICIYIYIYTYIDWLVGFLNY